MGSLESVHMWTASSHPIIAISKQINNFKKLTITTNKDHNHGQKQKGATIYNGRWNETKSRKQRKAIEQN